MTLYEAGLLAILLLGLVPSGYFCLSWSRSVSHFWSGAAFDAGGWVWALFILYGYSLVSLILFGVPSQRFYQGMSSILLGVVFDAILWARALRWRSVQRAFRRVSDRYPHNEIVRD